jgi:hypothetical protein
MDFSLGTYVQPLASHRENPERLLVRDQQGSWHLWFGDGQEMTSITEDLASWVFERPEMVRLVEPHHWFDTECLPIKVGLYDYDNERSVAD